uniref:SdrD B-like domain-containing protein n=1 Tax=Paenirhodobacter enshiensis TaxID=1105367 RepID=UPI003FA1D457
ETGAAGQTVKLVNAAGAVIATTTTAADGSYSFTGLDAGEYRVQFPTNVNGKVLVNANVGSNDAIDSDADPATGLTGPVYLAIGEAKTDTDAGVKDPGTASLAGRIFFDANGNNVDDGEAGVGGQTVQLVNAAGAVIASATTAADGSYIFTGLDAGNYQVKFPTNVGGKVLVNANVGSNDAIDSDADPATGLTGTIPLAIGEAKTDTDAGLKDPGTAAIGNFVFFDANANGLQDTGEAGVSGVKVTLYSAAGAVLATTTTDASGKYLFDGLKAGTYKVGFEEKVGYNFTTADVGSNDTLDSDANVVTGLTAPITLGIGQINLTVDAGLVAEFVNTPPVAVNDVAGTCADVPKTVDVLANDSDADGHALSITAINGMAIAEGQTVTTATGTLVTLSGGKLAVNGEAAWAALDIGQQATETISYTISDGKGGTATANLAMTFCGDANTVTSLVNSLPDGTVTYRVQASNEVLPIEDYAFNLQLVSTGDNRLNGDVFARAYCLDMTEPFLRAETLEAAPIASGKLIGATEAAAPAVFGADQFSFYNGQHAGENLDLVHWILNQDFASQAGGQFNEWEVQRAIWALTNNFDQSNLDAISTGFGQQADVNTILAQAAAHGEGFVPGVGDIIGVIVDPGNANPANTQPFIIGMHFEDYDCLCG